MPYLLDREGRRFLVAPDKVADALRSGQLGVPQGKLTVRDPNGRAATLPAERLLDAIDQGWRLEEEQEQLEREHGSKDVKAFAAGAARGATLGLSDLVLTKSGLVDPDTLDKIRRANPVSSGVGEVVGAVGSSFIPAGGQVSLATKMLRGVSTPARLVAGAGRRIAGGAEGEILRFLTEHGTSRALAKAGSLAAGEMAKTSVAKQAMARGAAFAAAGAVEGSIFGVAQALDEKVLGDSRTVGELLVAHIGPAALAGGIAGGIFGGASEFGASGLKKLAEVAGEKIGEASSGAAWLQSLARRRAVKGLGATQAKMAKVDRMDLTDDVGEMLLTEHQALGGEKVLGNSVKKTLENIQKVLDDAGSRQGAAISELDRLARSGEISRLSGSKVAPVSGANIAKRLREELLAPIADQPGYDAERALLKRYAKQFERVGDMGLREANAKKTNIQTKVTKLYGQEIDTPRSRLEKSIAGIVMDEVDRAAEFVAGAMDNPGLAQRFALAKREYRLMKRAEELASKGVERQEGNRSLSLTDYLTGVGGAAAGVATGNVAPLLMAGAGAIGNKLARERGNLLIAKAADKAAKLRLMQKRIDAVSDRVNAAVDRFASGTANKLRLASSYILSDLTGKNDRKEAAREFASKLHRYIGNPESLASNIAASLIGMDGVAPEISSAVAEKTAQIVASMQEYAPLPTPDSLLQPEAADWDVDDAVASRFASVAAAHLDPVATIEEALAGAGDPIAIKALKQHYPQLLSAITPRILEAVALSKKKMAWRDKIALSMLLDAPVDPLLTPSGIRRSQMVYSAPPAAAGPQRPSQIATRADEVSGMFRTAFQKTESIGAT